MLRLACCPACRALQLSVVGALERAAQTKAGDEQRAEQRIMHPNTEYSG